MWQSPYTKISIFRTLGQEYIMEWKGTRNQTSQKGLFYFLSITSSLRDSVKDEKILKKTKETKSK